MKVKLRAKNWVKRELHKPCIKVVKAAAQFVKYHEPELELTFSQAYRHGGFCSGTRDIAIIPPKYQHETDFLYFAYRFFETACHELSHALDLIEHGYWKPGKDAEIAVLDRLYDLTGGQVMKHHFWAETIKLPKRAQEAILELAIVLETLALEWIKTDSGQDWIKRERHQGIENQFTK